MASRGRASKCAQKAGGGGGTGGQAKCSDSGPITTPSSLLSPPSDLPSLPPTPPPTPNPTSARTPNPTSFPTSDPTSSPIPDPSLIFSGKCRELDRKCELCEGDCDKDSDCADGLGCFIRDSQSVTESLLIPGCGGSNPEDLFAKDFCYEIVKYPCRDEVENNCSWVAEDLEERCVMFGDLCRETCGYCRTREPTSAPSAN